MLGTISRPGNDRHPTQKENCSTNFCNPTLSWSLSFSLTLSESGFPDLLVSGQSPVRKCVTRLKGSISGLPWRDGWITKCLFFVYACMFCMCHIKRSNFSTPFLAWHNIAIRQSLEMFQQLGERNPCNFFSIMPEQLLNGWNVRTFMLLWGFI